MGTFRTPTRSMGEPAIPVEKALQLGTDLEDEVVVRPRDTGDSDGAPSDTEA